MAAGTISNWKIYQDQFNAGLAEKLAENVDGFNAASNNAIRLTTEYSRGAYFEEAFYDLNSSLIAARDPTSLSAATDATISQDSIISPKLTRAIGPIGQTLNSLKKTNTSQEEFSFMFGGMVADQIAQDYLKSAVSALVAAIGTQATLINGTDVAPADLDHKNLITTMAKMGDMADQIACWVMHSSVYYGLVKQAITDNVYDVGAISVKGATTPTLGRPVIVTDNVYTNTTGGTTDPLYHVLGLVPNAIHIKEAEETTMVSEMVTGLDNLQVRLQGESAYTMTMKGFTWDLANGGSYPSAAAVATGTNWDLQVSSVKNGPGVMMQTGLAAPA